MVHDFKRFPELTNSQMQFYYWESPHRQITQDFRATVVKVHDADTVTLRWDERDFDFPLRLAGLAAPELSEEGGKEAQSWLEAQVLNQEVEILINPSNRVEKWGRILGTMQFAGANVSTMMINEGLAKPWFNRRDGDFSNPIEADFGGSLDAS